MTTHAAQYRQEFQDLIENEEQIQEAFSLSGDADFMLKVVAENLDHLSHFITEKLLSCRFIGHIKSYIVLKKFKEMNQISIKPKLNAY